MGHKEKWALAAIIVAIALYAFGLKAIYLCVAGALIYFIARPGRPRRP